MPKKSQPKRSRGSPVRYRQLSLLDHFPSSSPPSAPKTTLKLKTKPQRVQPESDISRNSRAGVKTSVQKSRQHKRSLTISSGEESNSSDAARIKFEARSSTSQSNAGGSSDLEDITEPGPSSQNRPSKRRRVVNSEGESDEESIIEFKSSRRPLKRTQQSITVHDSESDSDSKAPKRTKGRLVKGTRPSPDEEADDVLDGIDKEKIIGARLRGQSTKKSKFMKNLEKLRMKKRGQATSESEQEDSEDDRPIPGSRPGQIGDSSNESSDDDERNDGIDDFIVDDGDERTASLPAIFSMNTHQDLVHHFKIVCQYYVHLVVTSEAARSKMADRLVNDEYFSVPLTITRQKLSDVRDSIVSSVWRPAYKKALQTYPEFDLTDLDFAIPQCDACHLGGRLSKFVGRLGGAPYDRKTFKAVDHEISSDESDSTTRAGAPEFNLGRFCAQRTKAFHELCHWEYELFHGIVREVGELSVAGRGFVRIAFAGGITPPDDVSDADQVMDWLDQRGIINEEWLKVKHSMSRATNLEADVKRGKEDDF
ncbi:hypothetical protein M0805_006827 [Coniferiporia weirii]|nr:hypothetical protein M0805_006827 [Coniferiporia weirii]